MVPTLTVLKLDFKNLEFFRWSIGVVTDVLECRLSVAPWRKTKQGHACKKPGKQNGKRSNSNNKIHTNKLKKKVMQRLQCLMAPSCGKSLLKSCCFHQQKEEGAIIRQQRNFFKVKSDLLIWKQKLVQYKWHNASQCSQTTTQPHRRWWS